MFGTSLSLEVIFTLIGLTVAGLAAVLGIWMERDPRKPPRYAWALSVLILMATGVGMYQTYQDARASEKMEADMARMLQTLDKIAQNSDVELPDLNAFLKGELEAQSRANPDVVEKFAQRVSDDGGDPTDVLGSYLPPSEMEQINRAGAKVKPKQVTNDAAAPPKKRRALVFGGAAKVREDKESPLAAAIKRSKKAEEEEKVEKKAEKKVEITEEEKEDVTKKVLSKGLLGGGSKGGSPRLGPGGGSKKGPAPKKKGIGLR